VPPQSGIVGGAIQRNAPFWALLFRLRLINPDVLLIATQGARLPFSFYPPSFLTTGHTRARTPEQALLVRQELETLVVKGALGRIPAHQVRWRSPCFVIPKKDKQWRLIIDSRNLNDFLEPLHFQMESVKEIVAMLVPGDWAISWDLKDAYLTVGLHPEHHHLVQIEEEGQAYQGRTLLFGLSVAPFIFTQMLRAVLRILRDMGCRVTAYLDDGLNIHHHPDGLRWEGQLTVNLLVACGYVIHPTKSCWVPSQVFTHLGFLFNTLEMTLSITADKKKAIRHRVRLAYKAAQRGTLSVKQLASLVGVLAATQPAIFPARLYTRALYRSYNAAARKFGRKSNQIWHLSLEGILEIRDWIQVLEEWNGRSILLRPRDQIAVSASADASESGWGGVILSSPTWPEHQGRTFHDELQWDHLHSNVRELLAQERLFMRILEVIPLEPGSVVELLADNQVAVWYLLHMGGRIPELSKIAERIWHAALARRIFLQARYVLGRSQEIADPLSRWREHRLDWQLPQRVWQVIEKMWGPHDIDLFASSASAKLNRFYSWLDDPRAEAIDAFSVRWKGRLYAHPPISMIPRVLQKAREDGVAQLTLVAPYWRTAPYFPMILLMAGGRKPLLIDPHSDRMTRDELQAAVMPNAKTVWACWNLSPALCNVKQAVQEW
jgi:hypothetical protein